MRRLTMWSMRVVALAVAAIMASACSAAALPSLKSTTSGSPTDAGPVSVVPTPVTTAAPVATISPAEPGGSPTARPAMAVDGRLTLTIDSPATTLGGAARCTIAEGSATVSVIAANQAGQVGGHRIYASLTFMVDEAGVPSALASLEFGQGMEDLPADAGLPQYSGLVDVAVATIAADRTSGSLPFADLRSGGTTFIGADWPVAVSGSVEWSCEPIPAGPPSAPAGASGAAKLSGSLSGIFSIRGDDCPTPEHPDGFLSGLMDDGETILEVTVWPDATASFVLYPPTGDKNASISAAGPAPIQVAGHGWAVALRAAPAGIGPLTLDVEWTCDG